MLPSMSRLAFHRHCIQQNNAATYLKEVESVFVDKKKNMKQRVQFSFAMFRMLFVCLFDSQPNVSE